MRTMTIQVTEAKSARPIQELEELLLDEPGIERALVSVEDGEVKVELDEAEISESGITALIKEAGFHIE